MTFWFRVMCITIFMGLVSIQYVPAQEAQDVLRPYVESMEQAQGGMTLWEMIQAGGFIMLILLVLSIFMIALVCYIAVTIQEKKLVPVDFSEQAIQTLEAKDEQGVKALCANTDNIISRIISAGLEKKKRGTLFAKEAMENTAKKEVALPWQNITYLADIAAIAPLIGLLGTVLGMIQAFNVIAFQSAGVKPILLAGGVSKAMVTTAGGLIVAIPAMLFYTFFRARVQQISSTVESYSADIIKLVEEL